MKTIKLNNNNMFTSMEIVSDNGIIWHTGANWVNHLRRDNTNLFLLNDKKISEQKFVEFVRNSHQNTLSNSVCILSNGNVA